MQLFRRGIGRSSRPSASSGSLGRKEKVGASRNRGHLSSARAPRGSHASPKMAEDNSARLQAMQDAVNDAGNDVRALKVRARSPDLFFIVSATPIAPLGDFTERRIPDLTSRARSRSPD